MRASANREAVYDCIMKEIEKSGISPSVREICKRTGIRSTSTVYHHIHALVDEKRIMSFEPNKERAAIPVNRLDKRIVHCPSCTSVNLKKLQNGYHSCNNCNSVFKIIWKD